MAQLPAAPVLYTPETHLSTADVNRIAVATAAKVLELEGERDGGSGVNSHAVSTAASATSNDANTTDQVTIKSTLDAILHVITGAKPAPQEPVSVATPKAIQDAVDAGHVAVQAALRGDPATRDERMEAAQIQVAAAGRAAAQVQIDALKAETQARLEANRRERAAQEQARNAPSRVAAVVASNQNDWF